MTQTSTKSYRVVIVGASYLEPTEGVGPDGKPATIQVYKVGRQGDIVQLTGDQAKRLLDLGAVKEADAPAAYSELDQGALAKDADRRGIHVRGSGVNGEVIREDLVVALENHDRATQAREDALVSADEAREAADAQAKQSTTAKREK